MMYTRLKNIKKVVSWYYRLYIRRETPVIVFAPGRVGSMALHKNLLDAGIFAFKVEFYADDPRGSAKFVTKHIFKKQRPAKIITIVRDPISMMATYFFSKAGKGHILNAHKAWQSGNISSLNQLFISEVLSSERLDSHLYWYERDFKQATGIDIFSYSFEPEARIGMIDHPVYPTLILRTEMSDIVKGKAVAKFLGIYSFTITRENMRSERDDAQVYEVFKTNITIPIHLLKKIYTSLPAVHFLTEKERIDAVDRYSGKSNE